mmetsp:Transcript_32517/g.66483  ORF Transcript_32517/g.66483 Transcript_32517/m.66483 type:complete len:214 (+) Transcript_32517:552-1193(+)
MAFHPSSSVMAGSAPRAFNCLRADCARFTPTAAMIMTGVHWVSFVWKLILPFLSIDMRVFMSASNLDVSFFAAHHTSCNTSSNDRLFFSLFTSFFLSSTGFPMPSTTVSSSVRSSLDTSPKIFSSAAAFNPAPISRHFTRLLSIRFRGPMMICMARPTTIPLYRCRPTVMNVPKMVEPSSDRAWEITYADQVVSVYFLPLALGSSNGCGGGGA